MLATSMLPSLGKCLSIAAALLAGALILGAFAGDAAAAKKRKCGTVSVPSGDLKGSFKAVSPGSRLTCKKARSVLRAAVRNGANYGETLTSTSGRVCLATLRPEYGNRSSRAVACGPEDPEYPGSIKRIDAALEYR